MCPECHSAMLRLAEVLVLLSVAQCSAAISFSYPPVPGYQIPTTSDEGSGAVMQRSLSDARTATTSNTTSFTTQSFDARTSTTSNTTSFMITAASATAQVGEIVFLPCRAPPDIAPQAQVSWVRRQDWHILTSGLQTYTKELRFAVHHINATNEWTLAIKYVRLSDQGMYECQIVSGATALSQLVRLIVLTPRAVIPGSGEHHVDAGSTISLQCFIHQSAAAPQYIFWYHNARMINYDKERGGISVRIYAQPEFHSLLTVTNARPADSGNYTCDAANARPASIAVYITQANKIAAIQSRAVGSSSHIAVIACNVLWFSLVVVAASTLYAL